jgi:tetratricopeptide (TPR) repeat protein
LSSYQRHKDIIFVPSKYILDNNTTFKKGIQFLKSEQYEKAVNVFTTLIDAGNNNARIYSERGVTYFHLKRFDLAIDDMDTAVNLEPTNGYRYASRAYIKGAAGDTKGGIEDYEKAVELDPYDDISFNNLGMLQEQLGYQRQSKNSFKTADQISKDSTEFPNLLSNKGKNTHGNSKVLNTSKNKKIDLVNVAKQTPPEGSIWSIVISVFGSRKGLADFLDFVKSGFKIKE